MEKKWGTESADVSTDHVLYQEKCDPVSRLLCQSDACPKSNPFVGPPPVHEVEHNNELRSAANLA
eukprot:353783-Chlamydomonas_euryale.AAC.4